MIYDLVIIGGGPGGVAAGVYAARKKLTTALITDYFGGQSLVSADVQNWIGTKSVSGFDLGKMLESHLRSYPEVKIVEGSLVKEVVSKEGIFDVTTGEGTVFETKTILMVSGSRRKKLDIPGEKELEGKGVAYCSICDAPLFGGKEVAVVGGGNAGLEAVIDLLPYASKIYLLHRGNALKGDPSTQEKIKREPKVEIILNAETKSIIGTPEKGVESLRYILKTDMKEYTRPAGGIFVEIGALPNSDAVKNLVALNERGEVIVDHKTMQTSLKGIWAAGDVSDVRYKQNNISVGDAIKAVLGIYEFLRM